MDALLAAYAAGSLPRSLHALVGSHLELQSANRAYVSSLEESLGRGVDNAASPPLRDRQARLAAIFATDQDVQRREAAMPRALAHFFGRDLDDLDFRSVLPGIKECRLEAGDGTVAVLYRIRPGRKMPQHTHEGSEVTLVLKGGFTDESGHYARGDVAITDEHVDHVPVADDDEECICFAVMDAPLRLTGPIGRLFNRFIRH
jgi:putative transcriptional regulator